MISISLCMIVKNEEKQLAQCLDSLVDIVDEIIIVDTGSNDKTMDIARKYTEHVYEYPWNHDFAAARNYSISFATKDYVYIADADEYLDEENKKLFYTLKQVLLPEIDVVQMLYCNQLQYGTTYNFDEEYRPKLMKRIRSLRFMDPIHEIVAVEPIVYNSDIRIIHNPLESHGRRDFTIFQKLVKSQKTLSRRLNEMYAKELYICGEEEDFVQAKEYFSRLWNEMDTEDLLFADCSSVLAKACRITGDREQFFSCCLKGIACSPNSELCYELGEYYYSREQWSEAKFWYEKAAYNTESSLNIQYNKKYPLKRIEECEEKGREGSIS